MIGLYTDSTKDNIVGSFSIFTSNLCLVSLSQVVEYFPVKLRVLIQVDYVWYSILYLFI